MTLCQDCDNTRDEYISNGVQKEYLITFEYSEREDVAVAFWNTELLTWVEVSDDEWFFVHDTLIRFNVAPVNDQLLMIYRCTNIDQLPAEFFAGSSIKAQDLNDNFFVLKSAIEEAKCSIRIGDGTLDEKDWNKLEDTITKAKQINGEAQALLDDNHIFDAAAIAARHDSYVQPNTPTVLTYEQPGKIWNDTDDLLDYFWDANIGAWVSFTKSGPAGPQGDFGPAGKVIVSDSPPTEYPAIGSNAARPLENGDLWFDSYQVLAYIYYVDNTGPGQWVSISKSGPKGETGGIPEAPVDGVTYGRKDATWVVVSDVPTASATELGVIKVGTNLSIEPDGTLNATGGGGSNVNPTQTFSVTSTTGLLTLNPGGNTTTIPPATTTEAGLFSAADKTLLGNRLPTNTQLLINLP